MSATIYFRQDYIQPRIATCITTTSSFTKEGGFRGVIGHQRYSDCQIINKIFIFSNVKFLVEHEISYIVGIIPSADQTLDHLNFVHLRDQETNLKTNSPHPYPFCFGQGQTTQTFTVVYDENKSIQFILISTAEFHERLTLKI
jgi:hypothetical protein